MSFSIAIDGPGGSGKSTIAKKLSKKLGFLYIDTGAMYRAVALYFIESGIGFNDVKEVSKNIEKIVLDIKYLDGNQIIFLNNKDVTNEIRTEFIGKYSSKIAVYKIVRDKLVKIQRNLAKNNNVLMDGRDIGTFVLPNANIKIYLTASVDVRAKRRQEELKSLGENLELDVIKKEIEDRDDRDMKRKLSPLKKAEDAFYLDSSEMTENEVLDYIYRIIKLNLEKKSINM